LISLLLMSCALTFLIMNLVILFCLAKPKKDTANIYTEGDSERFLGEYVSGKRSSTVLASKFTFTSPTGKPKPGEHSNVYLGGNSRKALVENLDASLKRMGVGYLDVLYVSVRAQTNEQKQTSEQANKQTDLSFFRLSFLRSTAGSSGPRLRR